MNKLTLIIILLAIGIGVNAQKVKKIEYFFDADPGVGAATKIALPTPATDISNYEFSVDVTSLTNGFHKFYVRCIDDSGRWSLATKKLFYKQDVFVSSNVKATKLEYFIDTDPGVGNGTQLSFTAAENWDSKPVTIDLTSMTNGFHRLYTRVQDDKGSWSLSKQSLFYKMDVPVVLNPKIKALEYFVDEDPGVGSGIRISISPTTANIEDKSITIDLSAVTTGFHKLNLRALDDYGKWSIAVSKSFFMDVIPTSENLVISKVEYFVDSDPGAGNGNALSFTQGNNIDVQGSIDLSAFNKGFHRLYIRAKDNKGRWSIATSRMFYMDVVPITSLPNLVKGEYFIDTDPGFGQGTPINFTASSSLIDKTFTIDLNSVNAGFHKLFVRYKDSRGGWSSTNQRSFYKDVSVPAVTSQVAEVSYYIGQGDDIAMNDFIKVADFTPGLDVQDFVFPVDLTGKDVGNYYIYAFAKDFSGRYTTLAIDSFKICDNVARAKFSYQVASLTATFFDESELAANYLWDFGDGSTSTEASPEHTYYGNGKYTVCLTISNDCNSSVYCDTVTIEYNPPPTTTDFWVYTEEDKDFTFTYEIFSYSDIQSEPMNHIRIKTTSGLSTGDSLLLNGVLVEDGDSIIKSKVTKLVYRPAPNQAGYRGQVTFQVSDGVTYSDVHTISFQVTGTNDKPIFNIASSKIGLIQNCGQITIEDWLTDLDDGDPEENQTLSGYITVIDGQNIFYAVPQLLQSDYSDITFTIADGVTGTSRCKVTITDYSSNTTPYQNAVEKEFTISVTEFAAKLSVNKTEGCVGDEFTFTSSSPTQGVSFAWDFGSGATPKTFVGPEPDPVTYESAGQKVIKLTISGFGKSDSKLLNINVIETPTAAFLTGSTLFPLYDTVEFQNTSVGGSIFEWDFGDGTAKVTKYETVTVKHKYAAQDNQSFTASLTAKNGICTDVFTQQVKFIDAQPPVITVREYPETYNFSETKKVSISAHDYFYQLQGAKFYYKGVASNQWGVKNVTATNDSIFETNIEETMGDAVGIAYYFDVFNKMGIKRKSEIGYAYLSFEQGLDIPDVNFGTSVEDYQILAIPLDLEKNSIDSVFEELGSYDNTKWRLFHYNPSKLLEYTIDFQNLERGKGYWFIARERTVLNTGAGTSNPLGEFETFKIPLRQGWNQIGNPYNFDISWSDIINANSANASKIGNLRVYKNGNFKDTTVLSRFRGGFVYADEPGIELTIPVKQMASTKEGSINVEKPITSDDWQLNLNLTMGKSQNNTIGFGMNPNAIQGKDAFDAMTTPRFINYLEGNFNHPDYFYPRFCKDVVQPADQYAWDFNVETNSGDQLATISWNNQVALQLPQQLILLDLSRQKVVDMKSTSSYTFKAGKNQPFKFIYGDNRYLDSMMVFAQSSLGDCYPNPFTDRITIPTYLAGDSNGKCQVELCIYSLDGRILDIVAEGELNRGLHTLNWIPGARVKPGTYLCVLKNYTDGTTFTKTITFIK